MSRGFGHFVRKMLGKFRGLASLVGLIGLLSASIPLGNL